MDNVSLEVAKVQYVEEIKFVKFFVHSLKDKPRGKLTLSGFFKEYMVNYNQHTVRSHAEMI